MRQSAPGHVTIQGHQETRRNQIASMGMDHGGGGVPLAGL